MSVLEETDRYIGGDSLTPSKALRLAARIEKAVPKASRAEQGLLLAARERVLNHLIREEKDSIRIQTAPKQAAAIRIQAPKGERGPAATIALDRLAADLRNELLEKLEWDTISPQESPKGIAAGTIDPVIATVFAKHNATECLRLARQAEETYDYERALTGYQLAVMRSQGELGAVRSLVQFWTDIYADQAAIAALLSSPTIPTSKHWDLRCAHATALESVGEFQDALTIVQKLLVSREDVELLVQRARIQSKLGQHAQAAKQLRLILKSEPNLGEARKLLKECEAQVHGQAAGAVETLQAAIDNADITQARDVLQQLDKQKQIHPQLSALRKAVDRLEQDAEAEALVTEAQTLAESGDWRGVRQALIRAQRCNPTIAARGEVLLEKAKEAVQQTDFDQHIASAMARVEQKLWTEALLEFNRALDIQTTVPKTVANHPLFQLLKISIDKATSFKPSERSFEGLTALYVAQQMAEAGHTATALDSLREAKRLLRTHPEMEALERSLEQSSTLAKRSRVEGLLQKAHTLEEQGNMRAALVAIEQAISLDGTPSTETVEWRDKLRNQLRQEEQRGTTLTRWKQMAEQADWWRLKRAISQETSDAVREDAKKLIAQMQDGIANEWAVAAVAHTAAPKSAVLALSDLEWSQEQQDEMLIHAAPGHALWVGAQNTLAVLDAASLSIRQVLRVPAAMELSRAHWRLFPHNQQLIAVDCKARCATILEFTETNACIVDRVDLGRSMGGEKSPERLASETQWCADSNRLLVLETDHGRGKKSRLRSIDLSDGQVHHTETFPYPVFGLKRVHGGSNFTVQRLLDWSRPQAHFYNFAVVDGHAKVMKRAAFPALELPMHSVQRLFSIDEQDSGYLCQYWYLEPFTGQVGQHSCGLMQTRDDWSVYFQSSETEQWLREPARIAGLMGYHRPSQTILYPWQSIQNENQFGISGITVDGFEHSWSVRLPGGHTLQAIVSLESSDYAIVVSRGEGGVALRTLDVTNHTWGGPSA